MRWQEKNKYSWSRWFAWRPIRLQGGTWIWWEWIERRHQCSYAHPDYVEYQLPEKTIELWHCKSKRRHYLEMEA